MVFEKYGISPEEASIRGMKLVEYLEVESPDLCRKATEIPKDLREWVEKYEIIWSLPIVEKYAETRRLNEFLAFREILQNALDIEHELYGYDGIKIEVYGDKHGTHVVDRGRGITWRAFLIGRSEKPEWARGRFGEGLDLATLVFGIKGINVYFFTKDIVFKTYYDKKYDLFLIVMGQSKKYVKGTHALIHKWKLPKDMLELVYWKTNPKLEVLSRVDYSPRQELPAMPNLIFRDKGKDKKLYVRDIFVNYGDTITGRPFYYSYNLWWVELDPNRTNVYDSWELAENVKKVLLNSPLQFVELIRIHLEKKSYGGMDYYALDKLLDYYEGGLTYDYEIRYIKHTKSFEELISILKGLFIEKGITAVTHLRDFDAIPLVAHEGGVVLLAPSGMTDLLSHVVPKAHDFVEESVKRTVGEAIVLDDKDLSLRTLIKFGKFRLLAKRLNERFFFSGKYEIKVIPIKGRSHATPGYAYVDTESSSEVFVHEIAHALGFGLYGDAPDVSENFERCLEYVATTAMGMATNRAYYMALRRIENGCVYANPGEVWIERVHKTKTFINLSIRNDEDPAVILAGVANTAKDAVTLVATNYTMSDLIRDRIYQEPFLRSCRTIIDFLAEYTADFLYDLLTTTEDVWTVVEEWVEKVKKERGDMYGDPARNIFRTFVSYVNRLKEAGDLIEVYAYDIEKDTYVLKRYLYLEMH